MNGFDMDLAFAEVEKKFKLYSTLVRDVAEGRLRHLFVEGDQGLGKTFTAEKLLRTYELQRKLKLNASSGKSTPLGLYNELYTFRHKGNVCLFDDCDSVFENKDALNILKAATDTKDRREISWGTTSTRVACPRFFYEGNVIVLTNQELGRPRFGPLMDRVFHLRLRLTPEEKVARIITILRTDTRFQRCHDDVTMWIIRHHGELAHLLTVRTAIKCLELAAHHADGWQDMARELLLG